MSGVQSYTTTLTTNSDGDATGDTPLIVNGKILKLVWLKVGNGTVTLATKASNQAVNETIYTKALTASTIAYPRAVVCASNGTAASAGDNLYDYFVVNSPLTITIASGGNAVAHKVSVFWESL